jgi:hypothetical protein
VALLAGTDLLNAGGRTEAATLVGASYRGEVNRYCCRFAAGNRRRAEVAAIGKLA